MAKVELTLVNETSLRPSKKELHETLELILRRLNHVGRVKVELVLVGDKKIKTLNKQYRGKGQATDVLSFPSGSTDEFVGSIVVSVETAAQQATRAGIATIDELRYLIGHGFLHLLGYHHK